MRREAFVLALCACGTGVPATSTFDAGRDEPAPIDTSPGPNDALDASAPVGVACTAGTVRVVATTSALVDQGPLVDDDFVYWTELETEADADVTQGTWSLVPAVHRAGKLGESPTRLFATGVHRAAYGTVPYFAIDASAAYWIGDTDGNFGDVVRAAKDGTSQTNLVAGLAAPYALRRAGSTLFFISGETLYAIDTDGTNERVVATPWTATDYAIGATHVYGIAGDVVRVARTGGAVERIAAVAPGIRYEGVSVGDDGYVYVVEKKVMSGSWVQSASVLKVATDGGTPSIFVASFAANFPVNDALFTTADGACVVYTTLEGVFRTCSGVSSGAIGPGFALQAPVIDATSIYWRARTASGTAIYAACKM
jgi:hypothetical protein